MIQSDGSYSFDPGADFDSLAVGETRDTTVTYTISDGQGGTSTATVTVTVVGENDDPTTAGSIPAQSDTDSVAITDLDISSFFADLDTSDVFSFSDGGTLPPGLTIDSVTGVVSGTPDADASVGSPYTVVITASDGNGGSVTQTFIWNVVNPGPVATNDDLSTTENASISGNVVIANNGNGVDTDIDGDLITVSAVNSSVANLNVGVIGTGGGSFTIAADGSFDFDPGADFNDLAAGDTRATTVTYTISDGQGGTSTATLTVTVTGQNDGPLVVGTIPDQTGTDSVVTTATDVSTFFNDLDTGDILTFDAGGTLPPGLFLDANTGVITGTFAADASVGGPYTVVITASDGNGGSVTQTFTWTVVNPSPTASQNQTTASENATASGNVLADDSGFGIDVDPDGDALSVSAIDGDGGNVGNSITGSGGGLFTVQADGSYLFDPTTDFDHLGVGQTATTTVTYTVSDGQGGTDTATLVVTIVGQNDAPSAAGTIPDQSNVDGQVIAPVDVSPFFHEPDAGDVLSYSATSTLPPGLTVNISTGVISGTIQSDASLGGPYVVTITATDLHGGSQTQTFVWNVSNPAPSATNNAAVVSEDATVSGNVISDDDGSGVDSDPDGDAIVVSAINGSATDVNAAVAGSNGGVFTVQADGTYTFDPGSDFDDLGVGQVRFTTISYTISDGQGGTSTAQLQVTVTGVNDAPTSTGSIGNQFHADGDTIVPLDVRPFFDDVDTADSLSFDDGGSLPPGLSIDVSSGIISGQIAVNASTLAPFSVTITATDASGAATTQNFVWGVINPVPTAIDDNQSMTEDTTNVGGNVITDIDGLGQSDFDPDGDLLTITDVDGTTVSSVGQATLVGAHGTLQIQQDGSYTYVLDTASPAVASLASGTTLSDSFTYTISDGEGGIDNATLTIVIHGTNDAPVENGASADQASIDGQMITPVDASGWFSDSDAGDSLTFDDGGSLPPGLSINPTTGIISGTIDVHASSGGPYTVSITATDTSGAATTATIRWDVTNLAPTARDNSYSVIEDLQTSGSGNVITDNDGSGVDSDGDGDGLSVSAIDGQNVSGITTVTGTYGSLTIDALGNYTYQLNNGAAAVQALAVGDTITEVFTYTIADGDGQFDSAQLTILIQGTNDLPQTGGGNTVTTPEDTPRTLRTVDFPITDADGHVTDSVTIVSPAIAWLATLRLGRRRDHRAGHGPATRWSNDLFDKAGQRPTGVCAAC